MKRVKHMLKLTKCHINADGVLKNDGPVYVDAAVVTAVAPGGVSRMRRERLPDGRMMQCSDAQPTCWLSLRGGERIEVSDALDAVVTEVFCAGRSAETPGAAPNEATEAPGRRDQRATEYAEELKRNHDHAVELAGVKTALESALADRDAASAEAAPAVTSALKRWRAVNADDRYRVRRALRRDFMMDGYFVVNEDDEKWGAALELLMCCDDPDKEPK